MRSCANPGPRLCFHARTLSGCEDRARAAERDLAQSWLNILAQGQPAGLTLGNHAGGVRVAPAPRVTFGHDQHVLAQRWQQLAAERAAVGRGLEVLRRADRPPSRRFGTAVSVSGRPVPLRGHAPAPPTPAPHTPQPPRRRPLRTAAARPPTPAHTTAARTDGSAPDRRSPRSSRPVRRRASLASSPRAAGQWLRSALTSSRFFIFDRPLMPISFARFCRSLLPPVLVGAGLAALLAGRRPARLGAGVRDPRRLLLALALVAQGLVLLLRPSRRTWTLLR